MRCLVLVATVLPLIAHSPGFAKTLSADGKSTSAATATAIDPAKAKVWGPFASLDGTSWLGSGTVTRYRWIVPFEKMTILTSRAEKEFSELLTLNAEGNGIDGIVVESGNVSRWSSPRDGIIIQEYPRTAQRYVYRLEVNHLSWRHEQLANGQWEWSGKSWDVAKITPAEAAASIAELTSIRRARTENALRAAERARSAEQDAQQQAAYDGEQSGQQGMQQNMPNMLDMLNGLGAAINQQNKAQQQTFDRQMQSFNSGGSTSSAGAIIVDNTPAPTYPPPPSSPSAVAQSTPPPTYTNPTPTDTCKRRVPYNYGVYKDLPYQEGTRCLDAATVSGQ